MMFILLLLKQNKNYSLKFNYSLTAISINLLKIDI